MKIKIQVVYFQNLWDAAKAVFRGKFISLSSYIRKEEQSKTDNISFHFRKLEKAEQCKPKASRRKETIKLEHRLMKLKTGKQ